MAGELMSRASVLEVQGLIEHWSLVGTGIEMVRAFGRAALSDSLVGPVFVESLRAVDVAVVLCSQALFADAASGIALAELVDNATARVIPVLMSSVTLTEPLTRYQALPRDGMPILGRPDRDRALLEVIQGLLETLQFRHPATSEAGASRGFTLPADARVVEHASIGEIFRVDGPPTVTFIEPPNFDRLVYELRTLGSGLILEAPSKVGKSTAIRKGMEIIGARASSQIWWSGQQPPPFDKFSGELRKLLRVPLNTWLFIDDFHHLDDERYRRELAATMKILADQPRRCAKITLIGINPLGSSLVQVMPDLSGRFRILRLDVERGLRGSTKVAELISRGEAAANVEFTRRDEFIAAASGSFFLAQYLCNMAALQTGVFEARRDLVTISLGPRDVIAAIQDELAAKFRAPLIELAAFTETPPPRGAALSLLWLLARSSDGVVPVREARLRFPMLDRELDWLLAGHLSRCFREHPQLRRLLYYNRATQMLTMEDPELRFYLRELDWESFAMSSGHGRIRFHPEDGPMWPNVVSASGPASGVAVAGGIGSAGEATTHARPALRRVLHLSDLHFSTKDQAIVSYSQLATDLREQQVDALDALIVSGDLVNRAAPTEYDAARVFLERLMTGFSLSAHQVALVPGNHDVSWEASEAAYHLEKRARVRPAPAPETYIDHGGGIIELRNEDSYRLRFQAFAALYRAIKGVDYHLAYEEQATIDDLPEQGLCILGLNSAWQIDHHYKDRASIHAEALANAIERLGTWMPGELRIATFHHPLNSGEDSRIVDSAFMQQLAAAGFQLVLHGHVHKEGSELFRYDRNEGGRQIEVVAAGTFGAATREWVPGYPLEYNLLLIGDREIIVETRCRREINGAWQPYARWTQGPGKDPLPRYTIGR